MASGVEFRSSNYSFLKVDFTLLKNRYKIGSEKKSDLLDFVRNSLISSLGSIHGIELSALRDTTIQQWKKLESATVHALSYLPSDQLNGLVDRVDNFEFSSILKTLALITKSHDLLNQPKSNERTRELLAIAKGLAEKGYVPNALELLQILPKGVREEGFLHLSNHFLEISKIYAASSNFQKAIQITKLIEFAPQQIEALQSMVSIISDANELNMFLEITDAIPNRLIPKESSFTPEDLIEQKIGLRAKICSQVFKFHKPTAFFCIKQTIQMAVTEPSRQIISETLVELINHSQTEHDLASINLIAPHFALQQVEDAINKRRIEISN